MVPQIELLSVFDWDYMMAQFRVLTIVLLMEYLSTKSYFCTEGSNGSIHVCIVVFVIIAAMFSRSSADYSKLCSHVTSTIVVSITAIVITHSSAHDTANSHLLN